MVADHSIDRLLVSAAAIVLGVLIVLVMIGLERLLTPSERRFRPPPHRRARRR